MVIWMVIGIVGIAALGFVLDREIFFYEGVHLGPRVQGWLYDRWAAKYDADKAESQRHDTERLAQPLIARLEALGIDLPRVLALDVASGTGRFPLALLKEPAFAGRMIAMDLSREMLARAAAKLAAAHPDHRDRVLLVRHPAARLPFADATFDVASCLEALEIMPDIDEPLAELLRVLKPGGILITSRATEESGRVGKVISTDRFADRLRGLGFSEIDIQPWWRLFDLVWACKPGALHTSEAGELTSVLRCPSCGQAAMSPALRCCRCGAEITASDDGILLYDLTHQTGQ